MDEAIPMRVCTGRERWSDTCGWCNHHHQGKRTCSAFPEGIPDAIWYAEEGHRSPVDGDHGIQFEGKVNIEIVTAERYDIPEFLRKQAVA
ncbi:hypothetical protein [Quatrionicoccus australiensis]|uniref:hypothetical protein n=1 Tax=Quatrionicoccus australiensis TaxID=138118 RepID=UPI001CF85C65|nr:hypothetical protein [Quatrionicoccus australiensis]UCV16727.1 hypothetical protein KI612_08690 [Quatrionicoccus australiensis]